MLITTPFGVWLASPSFTWELCLEPSRFLSLFQVLIKTNFVCSSCFCPLVISKISVNIGKPVLPLIHQIMIPIIQKKFWNPILSDHIFPDQSEKSQALSSLSIQFYLLSTPPAKPSHAAAMATSSSDHFCQTLGECSMHTSLNCNIDLNSFFSNWCRRCITFILIKCISLGL